MPPQTWGHKAVVLSGVLTKAVCFAGFAIRPRIVPGSYLRTLLQVDGTVAVLQQVTGQYSVRTRVVLLLAQCIMGALLSSLAASSTARAAAPAHTAGHTHPLPTSTTDPLAAALSSHMDWSLLLQAYLFTVFAAGVSLLAYKLHPTAPATNMASGPGCSSSPFHAAAEDAGGEVPERGDDTEAREAARGLLAPCQGVCGCGGEVLGLQRLLSPHTQSAFQSSAGDSSGTSSGASSTSSSGTHSSTRDTSNVKGVQAGCNGSGEAAAAAAPADGFYPGHATCTVGALAGVAPGHDAGVSRPERAPVAGEAPSGMSLEAQMALGAAYFAEGADHASCDQYDGNGMCEANGVDQLGQPQTRHAVNPPAAPSKPSYTAWKQQPGASYGSAGKQGLPNGGPQQHAAPVPPASAPGQQQAGAGAGAGGGGGAYAPQRPARGHAAVPPGGAFSLKQPKGLSAVTIAEEEEFDPRAAAAASQMAVANSLAAINQLARQGGRVRYRSRTPPQRVYMKIPWAEPEHLPGNFLERLNAALSSGVDVMAVGVAVRSGCIELVFDVVPEPGALDMAQAGFLTTAALHQHQQQLLHSSPLFMLQNAAELAGLDGDNYMLPYGMASADGDAAVQWGHPMHAQGQQGMLARVHAQAQAHAMAQGVAVAPSNVFADPHGMAMAAEHGHVEADGGEGALEAAVLSGLLNDADPATWIETLHLQPPPGAEVLTQACGRVWISRWDPASRQWTPEKVGGIKPSALPRIVALSPPCILVGAAESWGEPPTVRLTVTNASSAPAFSARCRGRYLPVVAHYPPHMQADIAACSVPNESSAFNSGSIGSRRSLLVPTAENDAEAYRQDAVRLGLRDPRQQGVGLGAAALPGADVGGGGGGGGGAHGADGGRGPASALVTLELPAGLPRNGLVVLECKVGKLLSNWRPVLITEDAQLAAELQSLFDGPDEEGGDGQGKGAQVTQPGGDGDDEDDDVEPVTCDELLTDMGLWHDYLEVLGLSGSCSTAWTHTSGSGSTPDHSLGQQQQQQGAAFRRGSTFGSGVGLGSGGDGVSALGRAGSPSSLDLGAGLAALYSTERYRAHMAGVAVSLLEFAVDKGWTHTASVLVRQMLSAGIPWAEVLARCSGGLTLLHRAVRSTHSDMVQLVVRLGEQHGTPFDWQAVGNGEGDVSDAVGFTPLHLAAALNDGGRLAERILSEYSAACELWMSACDAHGLRPVDCARFSGHTHLAPAPAPQPGPGPEAVAPAAGKDAAGGDNVAVSARAGRACGGGGQGLSPGSPTSDAGVSDVQQQPSSTPSTGDTHHSGRSERERGEGSRAFLGRGGGHASASPPPGSQAPQQPVPRRPALPAPSAAAWHVSLLHVLLAPFRNDPRVERAYLNAIGSRYVLWTCAYLVCQICQVVAVAGRMVKELRAAQMGGMLIYVVPHVVSAAMVCADYAVWLRWRETLFAAVTLTRCTAKLLPVVHLLPYPHSSAKYMAWAMDAVIEGLIPALFEHMRAPLVLVLRAIEGVATGLLYTHLGFVSSLAPALLYALAWNMACGLLTVLLDVRHRAAVAAQLPRDAAAGQGDGQARGAHLVGRAGKEQVECVEGKKVR